MTRNRINSRKTWAVAFSSILIAGAVGGTAAFAAQSGSMIGLDKASEKALQHTKGKVEGVELERSKGKAYYDVDVLDASGSQYEIHIDAYSGAFLGKYAGDDNQTTGKAVGSSGSTVPSTDSQTKQGQSQSTVTSGDIGMQALIDAFSGAFLGSFVGFENLLGEKAYASSSTTAPSTNSQPKQSEQSNDASAVTAWKASQASKAEVASKADTASKATNKSKAAVTKEQAVGIAQKAVSGKLVEVDPDRDDGRLVYEVKLLTDKGTVEVEVDIATGKITGMDHDDDRDDRKDDDRNHKDDDGDDRDSNHNWTRGGHDDDNDDDDHNDKDDSDDDDSDEDDDR
ncbi:Peptidase propeptide and YPEB domain-containing protein [Paenibacillaceae bacterium GAS479]|nr:Peptidase propeptide and YPEB domain-containing protein [Paenibacillaceae bacterium GAS479]